MRNDSQPGSTAEAHRQLSISPSRRVEPFIRSAFRTFRRLTVGLVILLACSAVSALDPPHLVPVRVDHHVHLTSPAIQSFAPYFCANTRRFGPCDPALTTPHSVQDLLQVMDRAGIRRALVLSNGYLAESPLMERQRPDAVDLLRAANDWTVDLARRYPKRFVSFIAVDPIRPTALPEIARWRGNPAVRGVKLHLTASGVSLRDDRDLAALAAVFRTAAQARFAIVIHLRTPQMNYGAPDVRRFIRDVLPAAGDTPVQIAHAAGWGGIDSATLSALGAFADAIQQNPQRFRSVWFDLSGVWSDKTSAADKQALVVLIRRIGPEHFVAGSDWPYHGDDLADYYNRIYPELPLTPAEWAIIRSNVAPYAR